MDCGQIVIAIGIGCRRGAARESIVDLVRRARYLAAVDDRPVGLFSIEHKQTEFGLVEAAALLGLPLHFLPAAEMAVMESLIATPSTASRRATGIASVAEAAALAGAGGRAKLLLPKIAAQGVTCAIAVGESA